MSNVDLSRCTGGQRLLSSHGVVLKYVSPLPDKDYYDHAIEYPDGSGGSRTNDGFVFRKNRKPETDEDIIEILDV